MRVDATFVECSRWPANASKCGSALRLESFWAAISAAIDDRSRASGRLATYMSHLRQDAAQRGRVRGIEERLTLQIGDRHPERLRHGEQEIRIRTAGEREKLPAFQAEILSSEKHERHGIVLVRRLRHFAQVGDDGVVEQ